MIVCKSRGITLIEILVASALFALFSSMVAHAVVLAYRNHNLQTDKITKYRRSCSAVNLLAKELQECQCLAVPVLGPWGYDAPYPVGNDHFTSLQFFRSDVAQGWYLSEWLFDPVQQTVTRRLYSAIAPPRGIAPVGFDAYAPGVLNAAHVPAWEPSNGRLMLQNCTSFTITHLSTPNIRFVRVDATLDKIASPLLAEVKVREI